jgi:hypothetical protein
MQPTDDDTMTTTEAQVLERTIELLNALEARIEQRLREQERRTERMHQFLYGTDPQSPGLAMRLDRIERGLRLGRWLATGGLAGIAVTLALIYRIAETLANAS